MPLAGRVFYLIYHRPVNRLRKYFYNRSRQYKEMENGREAMRQAAAFLEEIHDPMLPIAEVSFLTGNDFWYQTVFCLHSLQKFATDLQINARFYDDGSLSDEIQELLTRQFPHSKIILKAAIAETLDNHLPRSKYPLIRKVRDYYPHLKKLTDIHAGKSGWNLVLDSDMLFFRNPSEIVEWLKNPERPIVLKDKMQSYGYSLNKLEKLTGRAVPGLLNVGLTGLNSTDIPWDEIEAWLGELVKKSTSYFLEQALIAMLLAPVSFQLLDPAEYIVLPDPEDVSLQRGKLQHYVAGSKKSYFTIAWKSIL